MRVIGLLGVTGFTGGLVADELARRGHAVRLGGRDRDRVRAAAPSALEVEDVRTVEVTDREALSAFLDGLDVLLTTVGPFGRLGRDVVAACVEAGVHYVDCTGEQPFLRWLHDEWVAAASAAGVSLVPAAGFDYVPGDLLAGVAASRVAEPTEVHVAYGVGASWLLTGASRGTRRTIAELVGRPMLARVGGRLEEEVVAEQRRLAWFPRPVGPRHAAGIPGGEPLSVPRHVPTAATIRTYAAVPTAVAELLQAGAALGRFAPVRRGISRLLQLAPDPDERRRGRTRWACVAEVRGADGEVARAWAYGHDVYGFTATAMVVVAERLLDTPSPGVLAPAELAPPEQLLDRLGARTGLRWSVTAVPG